MMTVRQNPKPYSKNGKTPVSSQGYDDSAAIWPQKRMAVRQTLKNPMTPVRQKL
jgi:hypothetical protein